MEQFDACVYSGNQTSLIVSRWRRVGLREVKVWLITNLEAEQVLAQVRFADLRNPEAWIIRVVHGNAFRMVSSFRAIDSSK